MAVNRHTCLPALARQARLTGGSRAGLSACVSQAGPPDQAQSGRQKNDDKPTPTPLQGGEFDNTLKNNII